MKTKMVIVLRKDLGLSRGKIGAQCAHASDTLSDKYGRWDYHNKFDLIGLPTPVVEWKKGIFTKIVLRVDSEKELLDLYEKCVKEKADIPIKLIKDAGLTELGKPTYTCFGFGPWYSDEIDEMTGNLLLYK